MLYSKFKLKIKHLAAWISRNYQINNQEVATKEMVETFSDIFRWYKMGTLPEKNFDSETSQGVAKPYLKIELMMCNAK